MSNNSTAQPSASNGCQASNRNSRTSDRPSSISAPPFDTTLHGDPLTDTGNQGRGQYHVQTTYGLVPFPVYANTGAGASMVPGYGLDNGTAGNSSSSGYHTASAFGQPMPPNFQPGQTGGNRNIHSGYPVTAAAVASTSTNPLPAGYPAYLPFPPPVVHTTPNTQGGPAGVWQVLCLLYHETSDEVRVSIVVRRRPPPA